MSDTPPIPPPTADDLQRDATSDYDYATDYGVAWHSRARTIAECWIRRAVTAERRADDLDSRLADAEAELQNHPTTEEHKIALSERNRFAADLAAARERIAALEEALRSLVDAFDFEDELLTVAVQGPDNFCALVMPHVAEKWDNARAVLTRAGRNVQMACCSLAPDGSGRTCDKPKGHAGDCWTYGGNGKTWEQARAGRGGEG